jgi:hypothetical protein
MANKVLSAIAVDLGCLTAGLVPVRDLYLSLENSPLPQGSFLSGYGDF